MSGKEKMESNGFRITDYNAAMCYLASERKAAMDAAYAQGVESAEARAVKRIDELTAELQREREKYANRPAICAFCSWEGPAATTLEQIKAHSAVCEYHPLRSTVKAMGEAQTKAAHTLELILEGIADRNDDWVIGEIRAALDALAPTFRTEASTSGKAEPPFTSGNRPACSPSASDSAPSQSEPATGKEKS